jgi:hypothetical protein
VLTLAACVSHLHYSNHLTYMHNQAWRHFAAICERVRAGKRWQTLLTHLVLLAKLTTLMR